MKFKIYISLPITGYDIDERKRKVEEAKQYLKQLHPSYTPISPFDMEGFELGHEWEWYMVRDLAMIDECCAIYFLNGWEHSNGCKFERAYADYHKILVFEE